MFKKNKKIVIEKKGTTSTTNYSDDMRDTTSDNYSDNYSDSYEKDTDFTNSESRYARRSGSKEVLFQSIVDADYKKPKNGTKQDNMSTDEIRQRLKGFIPLKTMAEKKLLTALPLFKTWVRYINKDTKQFRVGGLLMKVEYPNYIMLINTNKNLTWSVQLDDNVIFVRHPKQVEEMVEKKEKDNMIKEKLFTMYKKGELQTNKRK